MWILSLIYMSWTLMNLTNKVKEDQPHIFKRFYRTKDKEEGRVSGFGLGLYISSEIIKKHKGKIWVKSRKGKGSTFFVSLPMHAKEL